MKYVVNRIIELIMDNEPSKDKETMIRVDGFDNLKIYEQVAAKLTEQLDKEGLTLDIKLAKNKWNIFRKKSENTTILQSMMQHKWVAEEDSMTHYRNLHNSNVVVLLGTEDEEDKGGLANFQSITPDIIIKTLNGKYHEVFNDDALTESDYQVMDRLYKDLFEFVAIDICKLSDIADSWGGKIFNSKDFVELFFKELPTWGLPFRCLELPKRQEIMGRKNVLAGCYRFISRQLFNSKMSITQYNKYMKRIDYYNSGEADLAKYPGDNDCWIEQGINNYNEFSKVLKEFIIGENLSENTKKLLKVDYSIVEDVLEIGVPTGKKPPKDKVKTLIGEPLEVFANALFTTLAHIKNEEINNVDNIVFSFSQAEIVCMYSDVEDDEEQQQLLDTWKAICTHCGGVIEYLNKRLWTVNDSDIELSCQPENFLMPSAEGKVQEKNYQATFPVMYNILGKPTYVMSLKDKAGLVKMVSFVSVEDYSVLGLGENKEEALRNYREALASKGNSIKLENDETQQTIEGTITRINQDVQSGKTFYYLTIDTDTSRIFNAMSKVSSELPLTQVGDKVKLSYQKEAKGLVDINEFDNLNILNVEVDTTKQ